MVKFLRSWCADVSAEGGIVGVAFTVVGLLAHECEENAVRFRELGLHTGQRIY